MITLINYKSLRGRLYAEALLLYFCLFIVKIPLLSFAGSSVRPEDLAVLTILPYIILKNFHQNMVVPSFVLLFFLFVGENVISTVLNSYFGKISLLQGLVFCLRQFEYFLFFYVGKGLKKHNFSYYNLAVIYSFYGVLVSLMQLFGVIGYITDLNSMDRWGANTSGPYEYSVVTGLLIVFLMQSNKNERIIVTGPVVLLNVFAILMTKAENHIDRDFVCFSKIRCRNDQKTSINNSFFAASPQ